MGTSTTIIGRPGTGKTTRLAELVERAVTRFGTSSVVVASLTRTAAHEISSRRVSTHDDAEALPIYEALGDRVGTLHSICYRALGRPPMVYDTVTEFNEMYRRDVTPTKREVDDLGDTTDGKSGSDELLEEMERYRARRIPRKLWQPGVAHFADQWDAWKAFTGSIDFSDMIERALNELPEGPDGPASAIFYDEAQDGSRLELDLLQQWAEHADHTVIVGDDLQCGIIGSMIDTPAGRVPIEQLNPETHRLVCADMHACVVVGRRDGYRFQIGDRRVSEQIVSVSTETKRSTTTGDHRWIVRWSPPSQAWVVYLMRKGPWFRVGWCQLMGPKGSLHLGTRASLEGADAFWVLRTCTSKIEAYQWEAIIAARYGLPLVIFNPRNERTCYTTECISSIFRELGDLKDRAEQCLRDHGRDMRFPFIAHGDGLRAGGSLKFTVRACNLLPWMSVPVWDGVGSKFRWEKITSISRVPYSGPVFSINVEPHHNYCQDGIFVHNCLYEWRGASVDAFLSWSEKRVMLPQSHRLPRRILTAATRWADQIEVKAPGEYRPRDAEGEVTTTQATLSWPEDILQAVLDDVASGLRVMLLATCGYLLRPTLKVLRDNAIPFHNPHRVKRRDWNPLQRPRHGASPAGRVLDFSRADRQAWGEAARPWTWAELSRWASVLDKRAILYGAKTRLEQQSSRDEVVTFDELAAILPEHALVPALSGDLGWYADHVMGSKAAALEFPLRVARTHGVRTLERDPLLTVGTIHSVKGAETDVTYLWPDLSPAAWGEWDGGQRDAVLRTFYVGLTRARQRVVLGAPSGGMAVEWDPILEVV